MEMVAQLRESHAAAESQNQAIDLTKVLTGSPCSVSPQAARWFHGDLQKLFHQGVHHHYKASPSLAGFPSALMTTPSLKAQMDLLQQVPPSGHRANGSLDADLPITKRRRGRRKNVEGLELLFMGNKRGAGVCATVKEDALCSIHILNVFVLPFWVFCHFRYQ